ncbi:MAG: VCBS repeat-containing protein [Deltaproteobacteria bacterium]|nr:VCBS repeat-containing protein [Deltaproteobacteria bacterium]
MKVIMLLRAISAFICLLVISSGNLAGFDFTRITSSGKVALPKRAHFSAPNPDAPAYKSFMSGSPAGAGLASAQWPLHIKIGVVRVEFQPDDNPATTGNGTWGDIPFFTFDANGNVVEDPTVDSRTKEYIQRNLLFVSQYYEAVSQGKVLFSVPGPEDISQIYPLPNEMAAYGKDDDYSLRTSKLAVDAIQAADAEMDYSKYDLIMVFHAGCGQHTDYDEKSTDDIHPVSINRVLLREILAEGDPSYKGVATNDSNPDGSPFYVSFIQIFPETAVQDYDLPLENGQRPNWPSGALQGILGAMVHELGHYFGLPDLYDTFVGTRPTIGFFALMATGFYNSVSRIPCHPMAWSKVYLGWVEPEVVTGDWDNIMLKAIELWGGGVKMIKVPISSTEYFLIENRLRDENFNNRFDYDETDGNNSFPDVMLDDYQLPDGSFAEFDWSIPNTLGPGLPDDMTSQDSARLGSGVLIWHIDEEVIRRNFKPDLTLNFVNTDPHHLGVDLEEADGLEHLLATFPATFDPGFGSPFDVFGGGVPGVKSLELGNLNLLFGPYTNPNSSSYTGLPSNIEISGFRSLTVEPGEPVVDSLIAIDIRFNAVPQGEHLSHPLPGWPLVLGTGTLNSNPLVIELDPATPGKDMVQATDDGRAYLVRSNGQIELITAQLDSISGSPAAGDIFGDGFPEMVAASANGALWACPLDDEYFFERVNTPLANIAGRISATPVLADMDGDGALDIIIGNRIQQAGSKLFAINGSGQAINGFPVNVDGGIEAAAAVLYGASGKVDMIYVGTLAGSLYGFNSQGEQLFRRGLGSAVRCAPVVGRMGLPGEDESFRVCAFTEDGKIWSFDSLGTIQPGWPVETGGSCLAGGAIGDVDGDGLNELTVPVDFPDSTAPGKHKLYVLDYNGSSPAGFPIRVGSPMAYPEPRYLSAPTLADLNGNGAQEIIIATRGRLALAYSGEGSPRPVARFILGSNAVAAPVAADLDGDGRLDVLCADGEGYLYAYSTGSQELVSQWNGLGGGPTRSGLSLRVQRSPGFSSSEEILPEQYCFVYPNPVRGSWAYLTYRLGKNDVRKLTVKVYTTSGETVESLQGGTAAADGLSNQVAWNVDRYASGVYLLLVKAESASSGTAKLVRKFAVIK